MDTSTNRIIVHKMPSLADSKKMSDTFVREQEGMFNDLAVALQSDNDPVLLKGYSEIIGTISNDIKEFQKKSLKDCVTRTYFDPNPDPDYDRMLNIAVHAVSALLLFREVMAENAAPVLSESEEQERSDENDTDDLEPV